MELIFLIYVFMKIWFIGLGLMGIPMAKNIVAKWWNLFVWNRTPERASELTTLWAVYCLDKREFAAVDILITMVTAGSDVWDILFGSDGVVQYLKKDTIIIDMSTIWVEWAEKIWEKAKTFGIHFLDAPVTGSTPKAITGELTIFIGGDVSIYDRARPILSMMGTNLQYMWKTWNGQAMKLINNALVAYSMIGLAEVMKLSEHMWLSSEQTAKVIKTLPISSAYSIMKVDNFVWDTYPMMFSLANMSKDISLAHDQMQKYWLKLPMLEITESLYKKGIDVGIGSLDVSAIAKVL
jgi:3-hydroxyisobutyrate dehydrogenase